ncbi:4-hydroxy-tetrahydrodipicolinate synthase [Blattabacterium punctulatus]|uniref:4-hydroxy-tetrahydrodipicolinate synthase n=1 Tax=Blattabacterium punctulatus TaxID=164514 RepID=UPI000D7C7D4C|nr:4-hydroxy-tetrahydrodipicolinate synthase [Blattabacterium punctulatus]AWU45305.1 4-hydroxy-tetrahydrodipicolinate synthase [Blattabacterium punctulatus]
MKKLYGTGVALVTPFKKNRKIDFNGLEKLLKYIEDKVDYLIILGTTAETSTLEKNEKKDIIECIKNFNYKKIPLILGIGGNNTENVIKKIKSINLSDFLAILSISPYYNNPSQEGIYQHFKSIINNTDANIIIYNVPKRTGSNVFPETIIRLANDFNRIIGIKEASGNILQSYKIIKNKPKNFSVIAGDDFISLPLILGGGNGIISVIAQGFPDKISKMISLAKSNKVKEAFSIFYEIFNMIYLIYEEGNPTGIKTFLEIIGICSSYVRLPLLSGTPNLKKKMEFLLKKNYK